MRNYPSAGSAVERTLHDFRLDRWRGQNPLRFIALEKTTLSAQVQLLSCSVGPLASSTSSFAAASRSRPAAPRAPDDGSQHEMVGQPFSKVPPAGIEPAHPD